MLQKSAIKLPKSGIIQISTSQHYQQVVINRNNRLIFNALRTYQNVLNTA